MEKRRYYEQHTWVSLEGEEALVGITDYAQDQLGDIIFVELPEEGTAMTEGSSFATIESAKAIQDLIAPLSGEIVRCNEDLLDTPETINEDPYGVGWIVAVKPGEGFNPDVLLSYEDYQGIVARETGEGGLE